MGNNISFTKFESKGLQEENEPHTSEFENDELKFHRQQLNIFIEMFDSNMLCMITMNEGVNYLEVLDTKRTNVLKDFLIFDRCCVLADKYLLAMCFVYFVRAGLQPTEYVRLNFFSALYIAHKMEEDDADLRNVIFPWASAPSIKLRRLPLLRSVRRMWKAMGYRTLVSQFCCKQVIKQLPKADIWTRHRPANHGNAYKVFKKCSNCEPKCFNMILDYYEFDDDIYCGKPRKPKRPLVVPDMEVASEEDDSYLSPSPSDASSDDLLSDEHFDSQSSQSRESDDAMDASHESSSPGVSENGPIDELGLMEVDFFVGNSNDSDIFDQNNNFGPVK